VCFQPLPGSCTQLRTIAEKNATLAKHQAQMLPPDSLPVHRLSNINHNTSWLGAAPNPLPALLQGLRTMAGSIVKRTAGEIEEDSRLANVIAAELLPNRSAQIFPPNLLTVVVIGCGALGRNIAGEMMRRGCTVRLCDRVPSAAVYAHSQIAQIIDSLCPKGLLLASDAEPLLARCSAADSIEDALANCSRGIVIIEAVPEDRVLKCEVLACAARACAAREINPLRVLLCSNTLQLTIDTLSTHLPEQYANRLVGVRFLQPCWFIDDIELTVLVVDRSPSLPPERSTPEEKHQAALLVPFPSRASGSPPDPAPAAQIHSNPARASSDGPARAQVAVGSGLRLNPFSQSIRNRSPSSSKPRGRGLTLQPVAYKPTYPIQAHSTPIHPTPNQSSTPLATVNLTSYGAHSNQPVRDADYLRLNPFSDLAATDSSESAVDQKSAAQELSGTQQTMHSSVADVAAAQLFGALDFACFTYTCTANEVLGMRRRLIEEEIHLYTVAQEMAVREWKDASVVVTQPPSDKGSKTPSCPSSGLGSVPSSALGTGSGSGSVPSSALGMEGPELFVPSLWQVDAERDLSVAMEDEVDELQEVIDSVATPCLICQRATNSLDSFNWGFSCLKYRVDVVPYLCRTCIHKSK